MLWWTSIRRCLEEVDEDLFEIRHNQYREGEIQASGLEIGKV